MTVLAIDDFGSGTQTAAAYVLTHAHTDHHANLSQKFTHVVHCSLITKALMQSLFPSVTFVDDLVCGAWTALENDVLVYTFDSCHCVGGVGVYCPDLQVLHFGDGRPLRSTIQCLLHFHEKYVGSQMKLSVVCDTFIANTLRRFDVVSQVKSNFPTVKASRNLLRKTIKHYQLKNPSRPIHIQVAHFGALSGLPREFGYTWSRSLFTQSAAANLCEAAFDIMRFKQGSINVSFAWSIKNRPHKKAITDLHDAVVIILSANWFFAHGYLNENLFRPTKDEKGYLRIFLCSHASPTELSVNYASLCVTPQ